MSVELFNISAVGDDRYRVSFRVSGNLVTYLVTAAEDPLPGLSAPHSFWSFLEGSKIAGQQLVTAVFELRRTGSISLPQSVPVQAGAADSFLPAMPLWASRSVSWQLSRESIDWAATHLVGARSNSLFPIPFEHHVINRQIDDFRSATQAVDLCTHRLENYRQLQAPKASSGTRFATQLDPLDSLLVSAAAYELGERVEAARIPVSEGVVYSFRFQPDAKGNLWDQLTSFESFQERTRELLTSEPSTVVAETDISAFYHSIAPRHVGATLERVGISGNRALAVTNLLESYASEGLPVGPSASALFAEAILSPIDWDLQTQGFQFLRFNDDYRFFCRSELEAQRALRVLADSLWRTNRLTVQDAKTRISSREDYLARLAPDGWLERLQRAVLEAMYGPADFASVAIDPKLIASAQSVFQQALGDDHVAWVRLCKVAFGALPLEEKRAALPRLLDQIARVWPVAPQVGRSLEAMLTNGRGARDLLDLVARRIGEQSTLLPDYAATWLLHAFRMEEWPGRESLYSLDAKLGLSLPAARRELLVALRGTAAALGVSFDNKNPWQNRAHVWATGAWDGYAPDVSDTEARQYWVAALYDALRNSERD